VERAEERSELQSLNQRLEVYIMSQREKDAARDGVKRETETLRESFERELADAAAVHEKQLALVRKSRDEMVVENAQLKEAVNRHVQRGEALHTEVGEQRAYRLVMDAQNRDMAERLTALEQSEAALQAERGALQREVEKNAVAGVSAGKADLKALRTAQRRVDELVAELAAEKSARVSCEEDLVALRAAHADLTTRAHAFKEEAANAAIEAEDELRREFGAQLKAMLVEKTAAFEQEKTKVCIVCVGVTSRITSLHFTPQGLTALRDMMGVQLQARREEIAELKSTMEQVHNSLPSRRGSAYHITSPHIPPHHIASHHDPPAGDGVGV
jgi:hypothetical protein